MSQIVEVPLSDLLLDPSNARLAEERSSQPDTMMALAMQQGDNIVRMAEDVIKYGTDPTNLPAIVATDDQKKRYRVLEGNRRILTLKALEHPNLVTAALSKKAQAKLRALSEVYVEDPYELVQCQLFASDEMGELEHWIELRHTGPNLGVGLVEWDPNEKDRFAARHGRRSAAGQVLDFLVKHGPYETVPKGVYTNIERLVSNPEVRKTLGIDVIKRQVVSTFPKEEVLRSLAHMVEDLVSGAVSVKEIYTSDDRVDYASKFPKAARPRESKRLKEAVPLDQLAAMKGTGKSTSAAGKAPPRRTQRAKERVRTTLIPRGVQLDIAIPRINDIYLELLQLNLDAYPNAGAVLFRVFVELSTDDYLERESLMSDEDINNLALAKRMKVAAGHLKDQKKISARMLAAIEGIADAKAGPLLASTVTWNRYVHNQHVHPKASELRSSWDEIQPFMEKMWAS